MLTSSSLGIRAQSRSFVRFATAVALSGALATTAAAQNSGRSPAVTPPTPGENAEFAFLFRCDELRGDIAGPLNLDQATSNPGDAWVSLAHGVSFVEAPDKWTSVPGGVVQPLSRDDADIVAAIMDLRESLIDPDARIVTFVPVGAPSALSAPPPAGELFNEPGAIAPMIWFVDDVAISDYDLAALDAAAFANTGSSVRVGVARGLDAELIPNRWHETALGFVRLAPPDVAAVLNAAVVELQTDIRADEQVVFWLPAQDFATNQGAEGWDDDPNFVPADDAAAAIDLPVEANVEEAAATPVEAEDISQKGCGTVVLPEDVPYYLDQEAAGYYEVGDAIAGAPHFVPLTFHVIRSSTGTGGISAGQLATALSQLNTEFSEVGICFYQQGATHFINNNGYFVDVNGSAERTALRMESPVANTINIYFVPNLVGLCGESSFTFSSPQGILMDNDCTGLASVPGVLAHEVGHYFDLFHTHETAFGTECVNRTNCTSAGDRLCDTPADQTLSNSLVNTSCVYTGTQLGPCVGDPRYAPNPRNLMSYSRFTCMNDFSPQQDAKALATLISLRPALDRNALPAPILSLATNGTYCDRVALSWSASDGSTSYRVYRNTVNVACGGTLLATTTALSFNDTTAVPGVTYYYSLRGNGPCGLTPCSGTNTGYRAAPLPAPTSVSATDGTNCAGILVDWNAVAGATSYQVFRNTLNTPCGGTLVATTAAATTSFLNTTAVANLNYFFSVRAVGMCGNGLCSATNAGVRPASSLVAPLSVIASDDIFCDKVRVTYSAVAGATSYKIFRNTINSSATAVQVGTDISSPFDDTTAVPGTAYFYWVRAMNTCVTGPFSIANAGRRGTTGTIGLPIGVVATDGTLTTGVNLTWSAVPNADIYLIYRNTVNSSATATQIGTDTASPFTDVTGTPGVIYFYFVRAMNSCATSAFSLSNSGYRALSAPTGVNASDTLLTPFVTVTWNSVPGASHYRVYRNQLNNPATATALGTWQTGTTYHDASAAPFLTYFYWVRASTSSTGLLPSAFGGPNTGRH